MTGCKVAVRHRVMHNDTQAEPLSTGHDREANPPKAHQPDRLTGQPPQGAALPVALVYLGVASRRVTIHAEDQRKVCSATECSFVPGAIATAIPKALAVAMSTAS